MQTFTFIALLVLLVVFLAASVMLRNLVKAAIALAGGSIILTILLFMMSAPWAAVFELSVCAGLITVIFISAISMTTPYNKEETEEKNKERRKRFIALPFALFLLALILTVVLGNSGLHFMAPPLPDASFFAFKNALWNLRQADILGQIILILAGVYGVVVLFKERDQA